MSLKYETASEPLHISVKQSRCFGFWVLWFVVCGLWFAVWCCGIWVHGLAMKVKDLSFLFSVFGLRVSGVQEHCPPRQKSKVERLKAKVVPLST